MTAATQETAEVHVRWLIRRDMEEVLSIEDASRQWDAWPEAEFLRRLRERNCIGMVAERSPGDGKILGFYLCELERDCLVLVNLAVHPDHRRQGVGAKMVRRLQAKLSWRRTRLLADVPEEDLSALLFLKALGLRAGGVADGVVRMAYSM